jgi:hypothetical protein
MKQSSCRRARVVDCFSGACHRARIRATRWLGKMVLERDDFRRRRGGDFSLAPLLRGEGWGEGLLPRILKHNVCGDSPSPGSLRDPTSPRKRGEVAELAQATIQPKIIML